MLQSWDVVSIVMRREMTLRTGLRQIWYTVYLYLHNGFHRGSVLIMVSVIYNQHSLFSIEVFIWKVKISRLKKSALIHSVSPLWFDWGFHWYEEVLKKLADVHYALLQVPVDLKAMVTRVSHHNMTLRSQSQALWPI